MKAGIYETPNGNLIYVAKDRTIKATTLSPSSWPGTKVSHRSKDDTVLIEGTDYRCRRVSDVPNGCNDPAKALQYYVDSTIADEAIAESQHPELHKAIDERAAERIINMDFAKVEARVMQHEGYRPCHAQSARKHRRRGHHVVGGNGKYWWRAVA